jgi:phosphoribosylformylglycinamidine (FGAM) synthase PurS component
MHKPRKLRNLKKKVGEPEATKVITYLEDAKYKEITSAIERKIEHLATKEDLAKLDGKVSDVNPKLLNGYLFFGSVR